MILRSAKTIAQQVHRTRALKVLGNNPSCRWLQAKSELLDELGHIDSEHALLAIAKRVCELKPELAEGIEMIRRHREFDQLADELGHVISDYLKRHPATTRTEILTALEAVGSNWANVTETADVGKHQFLHRGEQTAPHAELPSS